jgi:regulator of sirC expression with transglutaminase-like and TPR domain
MSETDYHLVLSPAIRALASVAADPEYGLAEAALTIAKHEYPGLNVSRYLERLDELAERVWADLRLHPEPYNLILSLNRVLFEEEGFVGNPHDQYDPRNGFLNDVLDRKEGIPLTLSIVYLEVGWRLGLPLEGVAFAPASAKANPNDFLVKLSLGENSLIVLDPVARGLPVGEQSLLERLSLGQGADGRARLARALRSARREEILRHLLNHLREVYVHHAQWSKLLGVLSQILVLWPESSTAWRDRGALYQHLECGRAALSDLRRYLELEPYADDSEGVEQRIAELEYAIKRLH